MDNNDFETDTRVPSKRELLHRMNGVMICAIFLTGFCAIAGVIFFVKGIPGKAWLDMGVTGFARRALFYLVDLCALVSLLKIAIDEKPFSKTLTACIRVIAGLYLAASAVLPRLPDYQVSGFTLFWTRDFTLIDGTNLLTGLLLLILSCLIQAGFAMQKEMDEIL